LRVPDGVPSGHVQCVTLPDGNVVKAIELSGTPGILFRRHSVHGNVEAVPWKSSTFDGLNPQLHQ
jgi:2,3,4,5-tetrahydropyridine-2,6-dicarboxylate N-succinyltransferase